MIEELVKFRAGETAYFIRRFLFHPLFKTKAQRLGKVLRIRPQSVAYWTKRSEELVLTPRLLFPVLKN